MTYSSALFQNKKINLKEAQKNKYEKLFKLLEIKNNDNILEIGSGWEDLFNMQFKTQIAK